MSWFSIFRVLLLGLVWSMSIVVLGIAANSIALSVGSVWLFPNLALAVSIITHAIATPMLVISFAKKGAFTSKVVVELSWVGILWMLWLAVAVVTTSTPVFTPSCIEYREYFGDDVGSECTQFTVLQAVSWLITVLLLVYSITLFTLALLTNMRRREEGSSSEKRMNAIAPINAFFADATYLHFRCRPRTPRKKTMQVSDVARPERRDSKFAPQFEGNHPYWTNVSLSDTPKEQGVEGKLERGYSTSTLGSTTKTYIPSPLSIGQPQRAVLPSQSPYLATKNATAASMMFTSQKD